MTQKSLEEKRQALYEKTKEGKPDYLTDEQFLKLQYYLSMGKHLDLENPQTFNEKLQWLKLHDRNPKYTKLVDKYEVRKYVAEKIGEDYLIPLYGVYDSYDEIDFAELPGEFVLKTNHTSGGVFIIEDKNEIDHEKLKEEVEMWLGRNYYGNHLEWPYKNVKPRIVIEERMVEESDSELKDYKFLCFNGEPEVMYIVSDSERIYDFYDMDFNRLSVKHVGENSPHPVPKPDRFDEMVELARKLAADIPHVRVDFYNINGQIYFGELTFYNWAGNQPFEPESFDYELGQKLKLPEK